MENNGSVTPILIQFLSNWLDMFVVDVNVSSLPIVVLHTVRSFFIFFIKLMRSDDLFIELYSTTVNYRKTSEFVEMRLLNIYIKTHNSTTSANSSQLFV